MLFHFIQMLFHSIFINFAAESNGGCRKSADVVFVIDTTSNVRLSDFKNHIIGTIIEIIRRLDIDSGRTRVAAVQFTHEAKVSITHNRPTQPGHPSVGMRNEMSSSLYDKGLRYRVADWGCGMSASRTAVIAAV